MVRISRNREILQRSNPQQQRQTDLILYHGVRLVVNPGRKLQWSNSHIHSISRGFLRGLFEYSDFFQDHQLWPQHIGDIRRDYIQHCGLELGLESIPSQLWPAQQQELQSFRASEKQRYENLEHCFWPPSAGVSEWHHCIDLLSSIHFPNL